jgi:hypothetical protein
MKVMRRKGLAYSTAFDQRSSSRWKRKKGDVYNIFPFLRDPDSKKRAFPMDRAFTLSGIIDAAFFPIDHEGELQRIPREVRHEKVHCILCSTMVTCEERALGAQLLGKAWKFLCDADADVRLLIPSFTIVGPAGKDFELQSLADRLDKLYEAGYAVQETVAHVIQAGTRYWDRSKAKQLVREVVADDLLDDKALDGFLDVYEKLGPMAACVVGHYTLNAVGLTQRSALARFKHATEVVRAIKPRKPGILGGFSRMNNYLRFACYLDDNLPDYNKGRCPLAGACLSKALHAWADSLTDRSREDGDPAPSLGDHAAAFVYRKSACRMRENRCERDEQLDQSKRLYGLFSGSGLEIINWFDPKALLDTQEKAPERDVIVLFLIEHEDSDYKYTIGFTPEQKNKPLVELNENDFWLFALEASLQQMVCGEGPLCLCYPHQPAKCPYRPFLQLIWDRTDPDPEWENNWKQPNKKPRCIE